MEEALEHGASTLLFKRTIRLSTAIGDWTKLKADDLVTARVPLSSRYFSGKIPESALKQFQNHHYQWAERQTALWGKDLLVHMLLHSVSLSQLQVRYLANTLDPALLLAAKCTLPEAAVDCYCLIESALANLLIYRSLGTPATPPPPITDKLTELENTTLTTLFQEPIQQLISHLGLSPTLMSIDPFTPIDSHLDPLLPPSHVITLVEIVLVLNEKIYGRCYVVYPETTIKKWAQLQAYSEKTARLPSPSQALLQAIRVPVKVSLGKTAIVTRELFDLKIGDVISLNEIVGNPCQITLGHTIPLFGFPGSKGRNLAVKLLSPDVEGNPAQAFHAAPLASRELETEPIPSPSPQQTETISPPTPSPTQPEVEVSAEEDIFGEALGESSDTITEEETDDLLDF